MAKPLKSRLIFHPPSLLEIADVNSGLSDYGVSKCLQIKRGCFYAAKANIFCENAARSIDSPEVELRQTQQFHPDFLKSPRVSYLR